jgi:23S rRNA A1618 N6-methylase RlmF
MPDILLSEAEFAAIKQVIDEARAARSKFRWLAGTARKITRDDIAVPKLSAALDQIAAIDLENPRKLEGADAAADKPRTRRPAK